MLSLSDIFAKRIPRSYPESKALAGFEKFGLKPIRNYKVDYFYIDFAFPSLMVGVEIDSYRWHTNYAKDQRRHDYLTNKGWKIYHFLAKQIITNPFIIGAFIYDRYYGQDETKRKQALFEYYKLMRHTMSDEEQEDAIKHF